MQNRAGCVASTERDPGRWTPGGVCVYSSVCEKNPQGKPRHAPMDRLVSLNYKIKNDSVTPRSIRPENEEAASRKLFLNEQVR